MPQDILIFLNLDKAFKKVHCIKKIAKLFQFNDEIVKKYLEIVDFYKKKTKNLGLNDLIQQESEIMGKLQQLLKEFSDPEFDNFVSFVKIKKVVRFLTNYKHVNFQDMIGTQEEINPQFNRALQILHDNKPNVNDLYNKTLDQKSFKNLFSQLLTQIQAQKKKNQNFIPQLEFTIPYLQLVEKLMNSDS